MGRISVIPVGGNLHEMYLWLLPNEIRPYLGRTFISMPSGIVEVQNRSLGGHSHKSALALWQIQINNRMFSPFSLIVLIIPRPTPIGIRHEVLALANEGMLQSAVAGCVGLTCAAINSILCKHAATGTLMPSKPMGALQKVTPHKACFVEDGQTGSLHKCLAAWMRNLHVMRAGRKTISNLLLFHGYRAHRPTREPLFTAKHHPLHLERAQSWQNLTMAIGSMSSSVNSPDFHLHPVDSRVRVCCLTGECLHQSAKLIGSKLVVLPYTYWELITAEPNHLFCSQQMPHWWALQDHFVEKLSAICQPAFWW